MNPHMLAELDRIARTADLPMFHALDKLATMQAGQMDVNAPGSTMGNYSAPQAPPPVQPSTTGATDMAGMSVHCDKCFAEIKEPGAKFCPKCGNRIRAVRDIKNVPGDKKPPGKEDEGPGEIGGPTGGPESVTEELAEGSYADMGKYSAAEGSVSKAYAHTLGDAAHPLVKKLRAAGVVGGGLYLGAKGMRLMSGATNPPAEKYAGVPFKRGSRFAQLHFQPKGGSFSTVEDGLTRIHKATRKNTQRILARK